MKCKFLLIILFLFETFATPAQIITTIAGNGSRTYSGDGGPALLAGVYFPLGMAVDSSGNVYAGGNSYRVRKITPRGIITTFAGNGTSTHSGDGGPATSAGISGTFGLALDKWGNLYISDGAFTVRKVDTAGIITTVAGTGTGGYSGDGGAATSAQLYGGAGLCTDTAGNLYIADDDNNRVRKVSVSGIITTVAGTGIAGFSGNGGVASSAQIDHVSDVCADVAGNIYIADDGNNRVRKVDTAGIITTVVGNGSTTYSGDGGLATDAGIPSVDWVTIDVGGNLYVSSQGSINRIRKVNAAGIITTIAGTGTPGFSGDGGPATAAKLNGPGKVALYKNGDLYISDKQNNRIRRISARPYFVNGSASVTTLCGGVYNLDALLAANDSNAGNTESWSLVAGPYHGTASVAYTTVSTGTTIVPLGLTYTPAGGFTGIDTIKVRITDSLVSDTTTIYLTVLEPLNTGIIAGPRTVCKNDSVTLTDTVRRGTWSVSNTHASIDSTGKLRGLSVGIDTVYYTVSSNVCPATSATYTIAVHGCAAGVGTLPAINDALSIFPNPTDGTFTLSFTSPAQEQARAVITDIVGNRVKELILTANKEIMVQLNVPAGVYLINVTTAEGRSYNEKIVVGR